MVNFEHMTLSSIRLTDLFRIFTNCIVHPIIYCSRMFSDNPLKKIGPEAIRWGSYASGMYL